MLGWYEGTQLYNCGRDAYVEMDVWVYKKYIIFENKVDMTPIVEKASKGLLRWYEYIQYRSLEIHVWADIEVEVGKDWYGLVRHNL